MPPEPAATEPLQFTISGTPDVVLTAVRDNRILNHVASSSFAVPANDWIEITPPESRPAQLLRERVEALEQQVAELIKHFQPDHSAPAATSHRRMQPLD